MKRFLTALAAATMLISALPGADEGLEELRGLALNHVKLPIYNKQHLQVMVFCGQAKRQTKTIAGTNVVLDLIRRGADVDSIGDDWGLQPYALDAKLPVVFRFWLRHRYCDGIVTTSRADVDQESRMAYGDEPVFFRSPLLDLNGTGFEADLGKRTILVKSDVNIVVRMQTCDPRRFFGPKNEKWPSKYDFVRAAADSLRIDMTNNQILLVGEVKVDEERSVMTCNRMTLFLNRKDDAELKKDNNRNGLDSSDVGGISRVLCDGDVVITRKQTPEDIAAHGKQQAFADHLVYDPLSGTVTLTGDKKIPVVKRGRESMSGGTLTLHRDEQRAVIEKNSRIVAFQPNSKPGIKGKPITITSDNAQFDYKKNYGDFLGNVTVDDPRMQLKCTWMRIDLKELADKKATLPKEAVATLSGMPSFSTDNSRELNRIICTDGVEVIRRDENGKLLPGERGFSKNAVFDQMTRIITMTGDRPTLQHDNDSLSGRQLQIWTNEERVRSNGDSRVELGARDTGKHASPKATGKTVIQSDSSDLNYGGNQLTFNDKVKVNDPRLKLDCDKMDLFLLEQQKGTKPAKKSVLSPSGFESGGGERSLSRAVCAGKVQATDPGSTLRSDRLTLHFRPQRKGAAPGLFQSQGTELAKIEAEGNFELVNNPAPGDGKKMTDSKFAKDFGGLMKGGSDGPRTISADRGTVDFMKNLSEFHGKVDVQDPENSLKCEDLYLFAAKPAVKEPTAKKPDIDADPFAMQGASLTPTRINLTDNLDLTRVLAQNQVLFTRRAEGKTQKAGGHQADYVVTNRVMILTGKPDEQPWMSAEGKRSYADRILFNTEDGSMNAEGHTRVVPEK